MTFAGEGSERYKKQNCGQGMKRSRVAHCRLLLLHAVLFELEGFGISRGMPEDEGNFC
jgi:hypothetical protein